MRMEKWLKDVDELKSLKRNEMDCGRNQGFKKRSKKEGKKNVKRKI